MAPSSVFVSIAVLLAQTIIMAQGQTVTCRYPDSILANGTCFRYSSTKVTWAAGKNYCASMNGALAKVSSKAQIAEALKNARVHSETWIGANDVNVEGTYIWDLDQSPAGSSLTELWGAGELSSLFVWFDCCEIYRSQTSYEVHVSGCISLYGTLCMELQ